MQLNTQWPLKIQSTFPISLPTHTSFTHTFLFLNQAVITSLVRWRTGQATGVGCRTQDWLVTGAADLSQDIFPACHTKYPLRRKLHTWLHRWLPGSTPVTSAHIKWWELILNLRHGIDTATQKHNIPPTALWKSFPHMLFGKMMTPCYAMAGLCKETIKRREWIWIKRRVLRPIQQDCPSCTQTIQYKLLTHVIHQSNGPKKKAHAVLNKSYFVCSPPPKPPS